MEVRESMGERSEINEKEVADAFREQKVLASNRKIGARLQYNRIEHNNTNIRYWISLKQGARDVLFLSRFPFFNFNHHMYKE